jgi:tetratricopeptide (TPR) repeat protein
LIPGTALGRRALAALLAISASFQGAALAAQEQALPLVPVSPEIESIARALVSMGRTDTAGDLRRDFQNRRVILSELGTDNAATGHPDDRTRNGFLGRRERTDPAANVMELNRTNVTTLADRNPLSLALTVIHEYEHMRQSNPIQTPEYENPAWQTAIAESQSWMRGVANDIAWTLANTPEGPARRAALMRLAGTLNNLQAEANAAIEGLKGQIGEGYVDSGLAWPSMGKYPTSRNFDEIKASIDAFAAPLVNLYYPASGIERRRILAEAAAPVPTNPPAPASAAPSPPPPPPPPPPAAAPNPTRATATSMRAQAAVPSSGGWVLEGVAEHTTPSTALDHGSRAFSAGRIAFQGSSVASSDVLTFRDGARVDRQSSGAWTEFPKTLIPGAPEVAMTVSTRFQPDDLPPSVASTSVHEGENSLVATTATGRESRSFVLAGPAPRWYLRDRRGPPPRLVFEVSHAGPGGSASRTYTYVWTDGAGAQASLSAQPAPASTPAPTPASLVVTVTADKSAPKLGETVMLSAHVVGGGSPPGGLVYRWQPNPEARFTPFEGASPRAAVVFTRPGRVKVWVDVLQPSGDTLATVAESNQLELEVMPPSLTLRATPARPFPGQEVRITLEVLPAPAADLLDLRWEHTGAAISPGPLPGLRVFTFAPKDATPVLATVHARARDGGADAGQATLTVTAEPYVVTVTGPTLMGPAPRQWDASAGGLTDVPRTFEVFQRAGMKATLAPGSANTPRYAWTVEPEGCTLSNPASADPTISCSQPGRFSVGVRVSDAAGAALGSGSQSVSVAPQSVAPAPTAAQLAGRLRAEAKALQDQGRLREAIAKYRESLTYVPDPALVAYIQQVETAAARQEVGSETSAQTANRAKAGALRAEGKALQDQGRLREAAAKYKESLRYLADPALEAYADQVEASAADQEKAAKEKAAQEAAQQAAARAAQQSDRLRAEGDALRKQGKLRKAIGKYRESVTYVPNAAMGPFIAQLEAEAAKQEKAAAEARAGTWRKLGEAFEAIVEQVQVEQEQAKREAAARNPPASSTPVAVEWVAPSSPPTSAAPASTTAPAATSTPRPAPEGCQVAGVYEYREEQGSLSLSLRQSGDQVDGTFAGALSGEDPFRVSARGSVSRSSIRLTATSPTGNQATLSGEVLNECRAISVSMTWEGESHAVTFVRK